MPSHPAPQAGLHRRELVVAGGLREYFVYMPPGQFDTAAAAWPVVLAFHGGNSNAEAMMEFSGLHEKADSAGFLAVFPNGTGRRGDSRSWNGGNCCGAAMRQGVDDVGFASAILEDLARFASIDSGRVFATGMSNGAVLCYLLASRMAHRICAIAPVGGPMGTENCSPQRPVRICHFHGTRDDFAPYDGGIGLRSLTRVRFYSVSYTIARWVAANGCSPAPETVELPAPENDGTRVVRSTYLGGPHAEILLHTIHGGGHTWPGRDTEMHFLGRVTHNISANDVMWDFFTRHART